MDNAGKGTMEAMEAMYYDISGSGSRGWQRGGSSTQERALKKCASREAFRRAIPGQGFKHAGERYQGKGSSMQASDTRARFQACRQGIPGQGFKHAGKQYQGKGSSMQASDTRAGVQASNARASIAPSGSWAS